MSILFPQEIVQIHQVGRVDNLVEEDVLLVGIQFDAPQVDPFVEVVAVLVRGVAIDGDYVDFQLVRIPCLFKRLEKLVYLRGVVVDENHGRFVLQEGGAVLFEQLLVRRNAGGTGGGGDNHKPFEVGIAGTDDFPDIV